MRARRIAGWIAVALFAIALIAASAVWWSLRSERGNAWLVSLLPYVSVEGPRGQLLGDFSAQKVVVQIPGGQDTVTLTGLAWKGLTVDRTSGSQWMVVRIRSLEIARVDLAFAPSKELAKAPTSLAIPIEIDVTALHIGALYPAPTAQPVRELRAHLHLGANAGAEHLVQALTLGWDRLQVSGDARIASAAPLQLNASIKLSQQAAESMPAWDATAALVGPLAEPLLHATLRAAPSPERPAQALDARARLRPFAAWPLGELQASTKALDLSAFASAAPVTALTGQATATTTALDQPATLTLALSNEQAGRWNEGRLPVQRVTAALVARPDRPNELTIQSLRAELGMPRVNAGVVSGEGRWSPTGWSLTAAFADVQPALLDTRAPAMRLSGPLSVSGDAALHVKADLRGPLSGTRFTKPVQIKMDTTLTPQRIDVRELQAIAGDARAQVSGIVTHPTSDAPWAIKAQAALVEFDPTLWWPGRDDSPWRRSVNRLNATGDVDVNVPASAASGEAMTALRAVRGQASIAIRPSQLAGVPLTGNAKLQSSGGAQASIAADLAAEGNRVQANGRIATSSDGSSDAWDVRIDAPALARLAPIYRLLQPAAGGEATLTGALNATARVTGPLAADDDARASWTRARCASAISRSRRRRGDGLSVRRPRQRSMPSSA